MNKWAQRKKQGFTIVELLIVIVVIAILAAITIVAYNGIQNRAKNTQVISDIRQVVRIIELYRADKGTYPSTGTINSVYIDNNCNRSADSDGYKGLNWVPDVSGYVSNLPQSSLSGTGRSASGGCYMYASDGNVYVVSAWNGKRGGPDTNELYRRLGFREISFTADNQYYCNHYGNIGGLTGSPLTYNAGDDHYKHSYTISNITTCNETPPAGA